MRTPPTAIASAPLTHSELTTSCRSRSRITCRLPATRCLDTSLRSRAAPGSVTVTRQPGAVHRRGRGGELGGVEVGQQLPAALVALEAAAPLRLDLAGQRVAARRWRRRVGPRRVRTLSASTCCVSRVAGATDCAWAAAAANTAATTNARAAAASPSSQPLRRAAPAARRSAAAA